MHLDEIQFLVPDVLYDVGQIIGEDVSEFDVKVEYSKKVGAMDSETSELEKRITELTKEIGRREKENYGFFDRFILGISRGVGWIMDKIQLKTALMFYEGHSTVYVTPLGKKLNKDATKLVLAHELTHFLDDKLYKAFELRDEILVNSIDSLENYLKELDKNKFFIDTRVIRDMNMNVLRSFSLLSLLESHAAHIENKYGKLKGISPDTKMKSMPLYLRLFFKLLPTVKDEYSPDSPYTRCRRMIEDAEKEGTDFGTLLDSAVRDNGLLVIGNYLG